VRIPGVRPIGKDRKWQNRYVERHRVREWDKIIKKMRDNNYSWV
jgi:hypothetical protein